MTETIPGTLEPRAMGRDLGRRDGAAKTRGRATYADDTPARELGAEPLHAALVLSTIARGRVTGVDVVVAEALDGVVTVLTHGCAERLADTDDRELAVLQGPDVGFRGVIVAVVVAETPEVAREAADLVAVTYAEQPPDARFAADRDDLTAPQDDPDDDTRAAVDEALRTAPVTLDRTYTTPVHHNNPLEPHSTTALWQPEQEGGGRLTLWDSTQGVHRVRKTISGVFGLEPEQVRVVCPHVGGGFGSKGLPHAHVVAASLAARALPGRPVRLTLTRQQMFPLTGHRSPTIQRVRLAADRDGTLSAIAFDAVEHTSAIKEFAEGSGTPSRMMYAAPHRAVTQRLATLDVPVNSWMRAPGEQPGMVGPEIALDELAHELGVDPVELRIRNEPEVEPETGKPWSSRNLVACLRDGAERFGWAGRDPRPRVDRRGDWWHGTGVASSVYPVNRMPASTATVRFEAGRYVARIGAADLGTGAWTVLPQITADALGVDVDDVDVLIGDTDHPMASVAGGSSGTNTWGSALVEASREFREKFGEAPEDGDEVGADVPANPHRDDYAMAAFGAQFAEVAVHADTGEVRVPRLYGVFAAGRIMNPRLARSQFLGGMIMGLGSALHEETVLDPRTGALLTRDLADYHVPSNADVADLRAHWLDEHDPYVNAMGAKGVGEIGITGTAAAVVNAAWHATGVRVRDLPVRLDRFLV